MGDTFASGIGFAAEGSRFTPGTGGDRNVIPSLSHSSSRLNPGIIRNGISDATSTGSFHPGPVVLGSHPRIKGLAFILQLGVGVSILVITLADVLVDILRPVPYTGIVEIVVSMVAHVIPVAEAGVIVVVPVVVVTIVVVIIPRIPGIPA